MLYLLNVFIGSISGFIPLFPAMALFHFRAQKKDSKYPMKSAMPHRVAVHVFCLNLVFVLSVTAIPDMYHLTLDTAINTVPFADLFTNFHQYALNILLFVPTGLLLPMLWQRFEKLPITLIWGFFFSLSIEAIQLLNNRITDIDDLLMNTAGILSGYCLCRLARRVFPRVSKFAVDGTNHWKWEPCFCFCLAWLSMLFIQPLIASRVLGLVHSTMSSLPRKLQ